jgi:CBS domain-containing protein
MKINELMTKGVVILSADATVRIAADEMKKNDIGAIPIQDEGVLKGIVTDRDIVVRCIAEGRDPGQTLASSIMTPRVYACFEDQNVDEVVQLMKQQKVRRIVVLNRDERPIGIVSLGDIAAHASITLAAEALRRVAQPVHSQ